jgi:hypothetical protein
LNKLVQLLHLIDPKNEQWKNRQIAKAEEIPDVKAREESIKAIETTFENNELDYGRKLYLIENCIFGVDIQPIAIQISKLRFFISLISEQTLTIRNNNKMKVMPLPNLETKFVAANTLIGIERPQQQTFASSIVAEEEKQLKEVRHQYFTANTRSKKKTLREKDEKLRNAISVKLQENGWKKDIAEQIAAFDPYEQNASADWFDPEWMFGLVSEKENNGVFDIVIGNPPYVQLQNNNGTLAKLYEHCKYVTFARTGDIYCLFYERGHNLLKPQGNLCQITSNKWMRAGYGENTRKFLAENTNPVQLIDFAGVKVFESATVDVNILMFAKDKNRQKTKACVVKKERINDLGVYFRQNAANCNFTTSESWVILSPIEQRIKAKIEAVGTPLKDWDINIYRGILTGYNDAFIIDGKKKDELIKQDPKSAEIIRPLLRGRDIKRYGYEFADLYLLFIPWHFPLQNDTTIQGASEKAEKAFENQYPAIYNHLLKYKKELSARNKAETGIRYEWYALQRWGANYWEDFYKQKIAWNRIASEKQFAFVDEGIFIQDSMHFFTGNHLTFLCAVLNSKLFLWLMYLIVGDAAGGNAGNADNVKNLTIPIPTNKTEQKIDELLQRKNYQAIDKIVYELYQLSLEEIEFIESL